MLAWQADFFLKGTNYLKPLNMKDVAEKLDVHVSTISRIVSHKYCQCKWGIFPLKVFFPAKIGSKDGQVYGPEDLKKAILAELALEDRHAPLSDMAITTSLQKQGYDIQRRTVAKYRKLLHIPSAKERKVF